MAGFKLNRKGLDDLIKSDGVQQSLVDTAKEVENAARVEAELYRDTGDYDKGFRMKVRPGRVTVGNTDVAAHIQEWGSETQSPRGIFRRAVARLGLRLDEK